MFCIVYKVCTINGSLIGPLNKLRLHYGKRGKIVWKVYNDNKLFQLSTAFKLIEITEFHYDQVKTDHS